MFSCVSMLLLLLSFVVNIVNILEFWIVVVVFFDILKIEVVIERVWIWMVVEDWEVIFLSNFVFVFLVVNMSFKLLGFLVSLFNVLVVVLVICVFLLLIVRSNGVVKCVLVIVCIVVFLFVLLFFNKFLIVE